MPTIFSYMLVHVTNFLKIHSRTHVLLNIGLNGLCELYEPKMVYCIFCCCQGFCGYSR